MLGTLIQGRISVCGAAINASKVALVIAVRRGLTRRQFGPPGREEAVLLDYRTHQRRLLIPLATTYALHFAQERLVAELHEVFTAPDGGEDRQRRELETLAAGVKAIAHLARDPHHPGVPRGVRRRRLPAREPLRRAEGRHRRLHHLRGRQHGAAAARREEPADRLPRPVRRARPARHGAVLRRPGARHGGRADGVPRGARPARRRPAPGPRRLRGAARPRDAARAGQVAPGAHPLRRGAAAEGRHRRRRRPVRRARRHAGPRRRGRARVGRPRRPRGVRRGRRALRGAGRQAGARRVCNLYALSRIEAERGWYQEHGRLSSTRSKAVIKAVNTLCGELREHAELLVEAFGVPEPALGDGGAVAAAVEGLL